MSYLSRFFGLNFVFLLLASLFVLTVTPVSVGGQGVSKPSVPQFSVEIVGNYYYVPPSSTTIIDQYIGKENIITTTGYYKDERKIEVSIKNQPFTSYTDTDGKKYSLYYHVQRKGHFGDDWQSFYCHTFQSGSDYTTILDIHPYYLPLPAVETQLDFRVEAIIGHTAIDGGTALSGSWVYFAGSDTPYFYTDVTSSGWSSVQTVTIEYEGSPTVSPSNTLSISPSDSLPSDSDTLPGVDPPLQNPWPTFLLIIIVIMCFITIPLVIFAYHYGQRKNKFLNGDSVKKVVCEVSAI